MLADTPRAASKEQGSRILPPVRITGPAEVYKERFDAPSHALRYRAIRAAALPQWPLQLASVSKVRGASSGPSSTPASEAARQARAQAALWRVPEPPWR